MNNPIPALKCPKCMQQLNITRVPDTKGRAPRPGDYTICPYCTEPLQFNEAMLLEAADVEKLRVEKPLEYYELLEARTMLIAYYKHKEAVRSAASQN